MSAIKRRCEGCSELLNEAEEFYRDHGRYRTLCKVCESEQRKAKRLGYGPNLSAYEMAAWRANLRIEQLIVTLPDHRMARVRAEAVGFWPTIPGEYAIWKSLSMAPPPISRPASR